MKQIAVMFEPQGPAYINAANRELLKPFVLFDAGPLQTDEIFGPDWHAHSGVATLTFPYISDLHHQDSGGNGGIIREGGFQWMQAGGGIWHQEKYQPNNGWIGIQQLWVQLPPSEESGPVKYFDVQPEEVAVSGNTRVMVGEYEGTKSPATVPVEMTYLDVTLEAGETWTFAPPTGQTRGFIYARDGAVTVGESLVPELRMAVFAESDDDVVVRADQSAAFVVVLAVPSPYPIVHSYGQMHTNPEALEQAKREIQAVGTRLRSDRIID